MINLKFLYFIMVIICFFSKTSRQLQTLSLEAEGKRNYDVHFGSPGT